MEHDIVKDPWRNTTTTIRLPPECLVALACTLRQFFFIETVLQAAERTTSFTIGDFQFVWTRQHRVMRSCLLVTELRGG